MSIPSRTTSRPRRFIPSGHRTDSMLKRYHITSEFHIRSRQKVARSS